MKIGDRARFVGTDRAFHGLREGKTGRIVLEPTIQFDPTRGTCTWKMDGDSGVYVTAVEDLEEVTGSEEKV